MLASIGHKRPAHRRGTLSAENSFFIEGFTRQVPVAQAQIANAMIGQVVIRLAGLGNAFGGGFDVEQIIHSFSSSVGAKQCFAPTVAD